MSTLESKPGALLLQMLAWIAERPRTYGETMDAWRTSCPRLSIWEDALADRLVEVHHIDGGGQAGALVALSDGGRLVLERFG